MMTFVIIGIVLIALLILFWYFGNKPAIHKVPLNNLERYFEALLSRGYNGSYMIIQVPKDRKLKRFIQFSKYIGSKKRVGVQFDYPLADWSRPYYEALKELLKTRKIQYDIEETGEEGVPEFIVIDFKKDMKKAADLSVSIFQEIYGLAGDDLVRLYFVKISDFEENIGF